MPSLGLPRGIRHRYPETTKPPRPKTLQGCQYPTGMTPLQRYFLDHIHGIVPGQK